MQAIADVVRGACSSTEASLAPDWHRGRLGIARLKLNIIPAIGDWIGDWIGDGGLQIGDWRVEMGGQRVRCMATVPAVGAMLARRGEPGGGYFVPLRRARKGHSVRGCP